MYQTITTNIMVLSVEETIQFYEEKLGFERILTVPEEGEHFVFAIMKKDNVSIMLQEKQSLIEEYKTLETNHIKPMFTLFITVDNVEKLYEELKDNVEIAKELHQTFYGKPEFAIFDNNQNILTISC
ncbi:MAG: VOC family protein [Firmicutes bacterium]|nr:VOC family protein [Bacillota bacterium]